MSETFVGLHSALCCGGFCNGSVSLIPQSPEFWPGGFVDPIGPWRTFRSTTKQQDFTEHLQRISLWFLAVLSFHSDASQPHIWMETPQPGTAWTGESVQTSEPGTTGVSARWWNRGPAAHPGQQGGSESRPPRPLSNTFSDRPLKLLFG